MMLRALIARFGLCLVLLCSAALADDLLNPSVAFVPTVRALDGETIEVRFAIAKGYYLYRDKFRFTAEPASVQLAAPLTRRGKEKDDDTFGKVEVYYQEAVIRVPVERNSSGRLSLALHITSQGCADVGVCYPPQKQTLAVDLPDPATTPAAPPFGETSSDESGRIAQLLEDASLWLVPWSALTLADGRYAVEQYEFLYVVSGRDLVATRAAVAKTSQPVIMADPAFDITPREALAATRAVLRDEFDGKQLVMRSVGRNSVIPRVARLPGTAAEAAAIAPKLAAYAGADAVKYTNKYALEGVFKKLAHPKALVMSTHGFFLDDQKATNDEQPGEEASAATDDGGKPLENPLLRCGLLLAGCNARDTAGSGEDGILTGLEVVGTDLRGTDLVVLSACETGLGRVNNGEGVAGLRQAFQLAGASSVVATLWQIPDEDTALLMAGFFNNLSAGESKSAALRNAQLARIAARRQHGRAAHPLYWAAFTLTGL